MGATARALSRKYNSDAPEWPNIEVSSIPDSEIPKKKYNSGCLREDWLRRSGDDIKKIGEQIAIIDIVIKILVTSKEFWRAAPRSEATDAMSTRNILPLPIIDCDLYSSR